MQSQARRVSKACDACKLRKVKCNGQEPCQQCSHLGLRCIFSVSTNKRTQGKRGRIITEYKNKTANPAATASVSLLPARPSPAGYQTPSHGDYAHTLDQNAAPPDLRGRVHYDQRFFLDLIPDYMLGVYPVQPVITEAELRSYIQAMDMDLDARSFIYAFGGCTLNLTRVGNNRTDEVTRTIEQLMNYSIEDMRRSQADFHASVRRAMQSMFLHNCLMTMQASDAAFYYIRDAISVIQLLRIDSDDALMPLPPPERARRQRLYWQAYIHERFLAVLDYRQAILPPLNTLPEEDPTIPIAVYEGFNQIIKLFRLLDPEFLKNWLGSQTAGSVSGAWIEAKSRELDDQDEHELQGFGMAVLSTMQRADLAITREWLRTIVWRLAMSQSLLSSRSSKECLSLLFPVRLSKNLRQQVGSMSREDIEVHGSSIVQKLFEITDTIASVLIHVPAPTLEETALRIDDFLFILDFVLLFPTLDQTRRHILTEKLERLQAMFPEVVSATSSPATLYDSQAHSQSPTNDPWYQVTQSKLGPEPGMQLDAADAHSVEALLDPAPGRPGARVTPTAAWNHISRRLSTANIPQQS